MSSDYELDEDTWKNFLSPIKEESESSSSDSDEDEIAKNVRRSGWLAAKNKVPTPV